MDPNDAGPSTSKAALAKDTAQKKSGGGHNRGWRHRPHYGQTNAVPMEKPTTVPIPTARTTTANGQYQGWSLYFPTEGKEQASELQKLAVNLLSNRKYS